MKARVMTKCATGRKMVPLVRTWASLAPQTIARRCQTAPMLAHHVARNRNVNPPAARDAVLPCCPYGRACARADAAFLRALCFGWGTKRHSFFAPNEGTGRGKIRGHEFETRSKKNDHNAHNL